MDGWADQQRAFLTDSSAIRMQYARNQRAIYHGEGGREDVTNSLRSAKQFLRVALAPE